MPGFENNRTCVEILAAVAANGGRIDAQTMARVRWPQSPHWTRAVRKGGSGEDRPSGGRIVSAAAGLLGRVAWRGLLRRTGRGSYEITDRGRAFLASSGGASAVGAATTNAPAPAPTPAAVPPLFVGKRVWAFAPDGRWYPATIVQFHGPYVLVAFLNGALQWVDARCIAPRVAAGERPNGAAGLPK